MKDHIILALASSLVMAGFPALSRSLLALSDRHLTTLSSVGGGAGLAYVFLYLLFELASEGASKIHALLSLGPAPLETLFILLLSAVSATHIFQLELEKTPGSRDDHLGFVLLFFTYDVLAGAGLAEEAAWGILNLAFYVVAIGVHLLFNDLFLLHRYPTDHTARWRFLMGSAPVLGCGLAIGFGIPTGVLYISLALVAGGTTMNVLRRELPELRSFRPTAFIAGVVVYAALIFATWRF